VLPVPSTEPLLEAVVSVLVLVAALVLDSEPETGLAPLPSPSPPVSSPHPSTHTITLVEPSQPRAKGKLLLPHHRSGRRWREASRSPRRHAPDVHAHGFRGVGGFLLAKLMLGPGWRKMFGRTMPRLLDHVDENGVLQPGADFPPKF